MRHRRAHRAHRVVRRAGLHELAVRRRLRRAPDGVREQSSEAVLRGCLVPGNRDAPQHRLLPCSIVPLAGAATRLPGLLVIVASAALLGLVLVEAALLMEVPLAAANGDAATVVTTFDLSNGVFTRVFPLAPASAAYVGLGAIILGSHVLHRWFGYVAVGLGLAFELAGIIALFTIVGLILAIVLSVAQELWIIAAAVAILGRR